MGFQWNEIMLVNQFWNYFHIWGCKELSKSYYPRLFV